ncbi:MAG TPA: DNA-binding protein [Halieaceae bacterium]|nr:DNA-binding protein [Halieaceae bacterium]
MDNRKYLTRPQAADFLAERGYPCTKGTLQKIASTGGGPRYRLFGNRALYTPDDLLEWAEDRCSEPKLSA